MSTQTNQVVDAHSAIEYTRRLIEELRKFERTGILDATAVAGAVGVLDALVESDVTAIPIEVGWTDFECLSGSITDAFRIVDCTNGESLYSHTYIMPDGVVFMDHSAQSEDLGTYVVRNRGATEALSTVFGIEPPRDAAVQPGDLFSIVKAVVEGKAQLPTKAQCRVYWVRGLEPVVIRCSGGATTITVASRDRAVVVAPRGVFSYGRETATLLFDIFHAY